MIDAALQGLSQLFTVESLFWMLAGVVGGLLIGLIPGIGSVSMLSILVPFTLAVEPNVAFAMLIGFIAVACTGDSIPAILLGIPGSASSQATIIDGHAMAKNGEGARALGASFTASCLGGLFGALVLSLMIQVIRPFVLSFGAPEFLMMALWGLSMVAILSGKTPLKGLIVGGVGLLLGMVGMDPNLGFPRWTFSNSYFLEGISLAMIGLSIFAVPELVSLAVRRGKISEVTVSKNLFRGQIQGAKDVLRHPRIFLSTSGFGTLVGAIPGIGNAVVDWLAYGMTVQMSKNKERFGKGDVRGVIGIDGSNNATTGGGLIPTLGFGIPGSTSMAFLLIVMFAHGLPYGAGLLTNTNSLSFIYFLIWGLVMANIVGALICFSSAGVLVKVTTIPYYYLFALLIPIMFMAAYYNKNSMYDLLVLIVFSVFGYALKQLGWPRPPLLIGIVLAASVESNFGISLSVFGFSWVYRPIVLVMGLMIIAGLFWSLRSSKTLQESFAPKADPPSEAAESAERIALSRRFMKSGSIFTVFLLLVVAGCVLSAVSWPAQARLFPLVVSIPTFFFIAAQLIKDLRRTKEEGGLHFDVSPDLPDDPGKAMKRAAATFGWILALLLAVYLIGLAVVLPFFTLAYLRFVGQTRWITAIVWAAVLEALVLSFGQFAGIYWNTGLLAGLL